MFWGNAIKKKFSWWQCVELGVWRQEVKTLKIAREILVPGNLEDIANIKYQKTLITK